MTEVINVKAPSTLNLPRRNTFYTRHGKRVFDLGFALVLLPILLPIIFVLAIFVKLDGGPALFGHTRIGLNGREFKCLKLRTMRPDAEDYLKDYLRKNPAACIEWKENFKLRNDPRITRWGNFLRKSSLDELPQIFNVIRGEMSFVGPRPVTGKELEIYGPASSAYIAGRPGITGAWQLNGRNSLTYNERIAMDVAYRQGECLVLDVSLIAKTPLKIIVATGI